jgi:ribonuclease-3
MISFFFKKKKSTLLSEKFLNFLALKLGIKPVNERLYLEAITHSSYKNIQKNNLDNERLEFLGDAFISLTVANYLYDIYPNDNEGYLTQLRAKIVSRENLNKIGQDLGLQEFILYQKSSNSYKSLVGNTFEALYGAILIDLGIEKAKKSIEDFILKSNLDIDKIILENQDYKSEVLMMYQKKGSKISFNTIRDNNTEKIWFSSTILERETIIGKGNGSSKKSAEQNACKYILNEISSF